MTIRYDKLIPREDGSRLKIKTALCADEGGGFDGKNKRHYYTSYVQVCAKGKRLFRAPMESERATLEEIHSAQLELWQSIKPELNQE